MQALHEKNQSFFSINSFNILLFLFVFHAQLVLQSDEYNIL